jgi:hypothetical protein
MSESGVFAPLGGNFATSRRGRIDQTEAQFIAEKILSGVPVQHIAHQAGRPLCDVQMIAAAMPKLERRPYAPPKPPVRFSEGRMPEDRQILTIARAVAAKHGLTVADLKGPSRARRCAHPRQEAMWGALKAGYPSTVVGRWFGGRDHSTALWAIKQHERRLQEQDGGGHVT